MSNLFDDFVTLATGEKKFWTHWQWYKKVFGEVIFKFFVSFISLLPIISKVFQAPTQSNSVANVETQLRSLFDWRALWLAAIFYLIAYLLYSLFCPKFIRTYNNFKDYKDYSHSPRWLVWLSEGIFKDKKQFPLLVQRLEIKGYLVKTSATLPQSGRQEKYVIDVLKNQTILSFAENGYYYEFGMPRLLDNSLDKEATEIAEREIFWELFGRYSSSRKYVRMIISILLAFSIALFGFVVLQYMISMTKYIF